jgi:hypothetical protein
MSRKKRKGKPWWRQINQSEDPIVKTDASMGFSAIDLKKVNELLGGFDNRVAIRQAVLERLKSEPRLARTRQLYRQMGRPFDYSMDCFAFNVESVHEDASLGRITMPNTPAEWVEALVAEYVANDQASGF